MQLKLALTRKIKEFWLGLELFFYQNSFAMVFLNYFQTKKTKKTKKKNKKKTRKQLFKHIKFFIMPNNLLNYERSLCNSWMWPFFWKIKNSLMFEIERGVPLLPAKSQINCSKLCSEINHWFKKMKIRI